MSRHRDEVYLKHMLEHARTAVRLSSGKERVDLDKDEALRYALIHLVCITGEVSTRVSEEARLLYPQIPWNAAKGMRNWLIHGYDVVDLNVVWDTVTLDFPGMMDALGKILEQG